MSRVATAPRVFRSNSDTPPMTRIAIEGANPDVEFQLHHHLADMGRLCRQARRARAECRPYRDPSASLFDELIETLERHRAMIADRLSDRVATVPARTDSEQTSEDRP